MSSRRVRGGPFLPSRAPSDRKYSQARGNAHPPRVVRLLLWFSDRVGSVAARPRKTSPGRDRACCRGYPWRPPGDIVSPDGRLPLAVVIFRGVTGLVADMQ